MDPRSQQNLEGVHPDLIAIIAKAFQESPQAFIVINGVRTLAEEEVNVVKGTSETLHSRHLPNEKGLGCAVDLMCLDQGHSSWNPLLYQTLAHAVKSAAKELNIPLEWGGDWITLKDWGHFQLPWGEYP